MGGYRQPSTGNLPDYPLPSASKRPSSAFMSPATWEPSIKPCSTFRSGPAGRLASECAFCPPKKFFSNFFGARQRLSTLHDGREGYGAGQNSVGPRATGWNQAIQGWQCDPAGDLFGLHHHSIHHRSSSTSLVTPNLCPNDYQQACHHG